MRSWDRTQIPKPFSRMVIAIGPVVHVAADARRRRGRVDAPGRRAALADAVRASQRALGRAEERVIIFSSERFAIT